MKVSLVFRRIGFQGLNKVTISVWINLELTPKRMHLSHDSVRYQQSVVLLSMHHELPLSKCSNQSLETIEQNGRD